MQLTRVLLVLALVSATAWAAHPADAEYDENVLVMSQDNIDKYLASGAWFVKFYAVIQERPTTLACVWLLSCWPEVLRPFLSL